MEKYTLEDIQATLRENKIPAATFIKSLNKQVDLRKAEEKRQKKLEAQKPIEVHIESDEIIKSPEDGMTHKEAIEDKVENNDYRDLFYDSDGLDDSGADDVVYFKVEDKFYEVEIHCEAEWVGDWSVRKNLPGDVSATKITELTKYKVKKATNKGITLEIARKGKK